MSLEEKERFKINIKNSNIILKIESYNVRMVIF